MVLTLSIFVKEGSVKYSGMFTQTCMSVLHDTSDQVYYIMSEMILGTVSMLRIRREKTTAFDLHSVNKAYIYGTRMVDMDLG